MYFTGIQHLLTLDGIHFALASCLTLNLLRAKMPFLPIRPACTLPPRPGPDGTGQAQVSGGSSAKRNET